MTNFTWADIYAPYARAAAAKRPRLVAELRACLPPGDGDLPDRAGHADVLAVASHRRRHGRQPGTRPPRRASPAHRPERRPINWSISTSAAMDRATSIGRGWSGSPREGIHFLSYHPAPAGRPDNLHVVPSADWPGGDLIASSDAILAKAGYGTVCEAMACGTPMIYPPRRGFRRVSVARPRLARLGRRSADLLARLPRAQAGARARTGASRSIPGPPRSRPTARPDRPITSRPLCRPPRGRKTSVVAI